MSRRFDLLTFDCYGTLVDWEEGIVSAFRSAAGRELPRRELLDAYAEIEPQVESGEFAPYRDVLAESSRRVAERLGWSLPPGREGFLADGLQDWPLFADTRDALRAMRESGALMGILSNVDDDLLSATIARLGVPFDFSVTAEQVRSYKPAAAHFRKARELAAGASWLHVACSYFHDVAPALAHEIPVAWIRRRGVTLAAGSPVPDHAFDSLAELADWLTSRP